MVAATSGGQRDGNARACTAAQLADLFARLVERGMSQARAGQ